MLVNINNCFYMYNLLFYQATTLIIQQHPNAILFQRYAAATSPDFHYNHLLTFEVTTHVGCS